MYKARSNGRTYEFADIREVMCKANEEKSGDCLARVAAEDTKERIAAKMALANITVHDIRENPAVPYEDDFVTRIIQDDLNIPAYRSIEHMCIAELREWILDSNTTGDMILRAGRGMTSEVIAAVCKLMSNLDLMYAAKKNRCGYPLQYLCGSARDALFPITAKSSHRRPQGSCRITFGGTFLRNGRCGHRT